MNLHQYYKENKDEINSSIMEIASDLAIARLVDKHKLPFDAYVEPEDPDDPDSGTCYKEEYQDEYNRFYDEEYNRLAQLMKFDITSPDGIARNGNESRVTEVKTVYATVRYDIENRNGGEVSEEDIDDILDQLCRDTKTVGDFIVNSEICSRNDESGFRKWKNGDIIALFPDDVDPHDGTVTSYMHIEQHGAADYAGVIADTSLAQEDEYKDLLNELKAIGYTDLRVVQRARPKFTNKNI